MKLKSIAGVLLLIFIMIGCAEDAERDPLGAAKIRASQESGAKEHRLHGVDRAERAEQERREAKAASAKALKDTGNY